MKVNIPSTGKSEKKRRTKTPKTKVKREKTKRTITPKHPRQKLNMQTKLILLALFIVLMVVSYFTIGIIMTVFMGLGILLIVGITKLLDVTRNKPKRRMVLNVFLIIFLSLAIIGSILVCCFLLYIANTAPELNPKLLDSDEMSIMYDKDGREIAKMGGELRTKITYDDLPQVFIDALVATEDSRYFQHNGFDAPRFLKASLGQMAGDSDAGGASTISMQVIKNRITSSESHGIEGIIRKFTDIYLAIFKLEKNYTKEQILEFYVNNHLLGGNVWGVEQAAQAYFNKDINDLNLSEAATLAGMFKSPNYYRPNVNPENATKRRDTVLYLMETHGYITKEERETAAAIKMEDLVNVNTGAMTFGNEEYQGYIDTVVDELKDKYGLNPYTTPMLIYTNMDRAKQDAVNRVMSGNSSFYWVNSEIQGGVAVLDTQTAKIQAIGAERPNSDPNVRQNYAASMKRQPGSTAKPLFDYGPGMEYYNWSTYGINDGDDNYSTLVDEPYTYSSGQSMGNWDGGYMGVMTLRRALALSRNVPALKAFQTVSTSENGAGNKKILEFVTNLGIEPEVDNGRLHEAHSVGAFDPGVSPVMLAAAYSAFSNGGTYHEPYTVERFIVRATGEETKHEEVKKKAMSDATAFMITSILQNVSLYGSTLPNVAVKTGTTNYDANKRARLGYASDAVHDSWVVGYTTKTAIASWYGYPTDKAGGPYCRGQCSNQRDLFFRALASEVFEPNKEAFTAPDSVVGINMNGTTEYFKKDHQPKSVDTGKISTPANFKATYSNNKVTLTWDPVTPNAQLPSYGEFGYNVYFNNTLLGFTTNTSYTISNPKTPYGTYKLIATFKKFSGNQSEPATYTLEKAKVSLSIGPGTINLTAPATVNDIISQVYVKDNGKDVTSSITVKSVSVDGKDMAFTNSLDPGQHTVKITFTYNGQTYPGGAMTVVVTEATTPDAGGDNTGTP